MDHNEIITQLHEIIAQVKAPPTKDLDYENLFSSRWEFEPRDLVYFFILIEENLGVRFSAELINDFTFFTLKNIANEVEKLNVE